MKETLYEKKSTRMQRTINKTSAAKCASNGTTPREKGRYKRCAFLRYFCRMLSSEFMLYNIVYNR